MPIDIERVIVYTPVINKQRKQGMQIPRNTLIDMAYDLAEIGVNSKTSSEMKLKVNEYIEAYEADQRKDFWLDKKTMVQREVK